MRIIVVIKTYNNLKLIFVAMENLLFTYVYLCPVLWNSQVQMYYRNVFTYGIESMCKVQTTRIEQIPI